MQPDVDEGRHPGVDAVLEGVLDRRDEEQRRDAHFLGGQLPGGLDLRELVAAQLHQVDIIVHEGHLALERDLVGVGVVEGVAERVAELADTLLRLVGVDLRQRGDVVERVEEEVRVELVFEPGQLGFGRLALLLFQLDLHLVHADDVADAHGRDDEDAVEERRGQGVDHVEGPDLGQLDREVVDHLLRDAGRMQEVPVEHDQQHHVEDPEPFLASVVEQEVRHQTPVVDQVDHQAGPHHEEGPAHDAPGVVGVAGHEDVHGSRKQKGGSPDCYLGHCQDGVFVLLAHIRTNIMIFREFTYPCPFRRRRPSGCCPGSRSCSRR